MRLFVALDLPDSIKTLVEPLQRADLAHARWTIPDNWHITLHFIGETEQYAAIQAALQSVVAEAFEMKLQGIGTFPETGQPRILWSGINAPDDLQQLHQNVGAALQTTGYQPEARPYNPHLTLARFKKDKPSPEQFEAYFDTHRTFQTPIFQITHFTLYESQFTDGGVRYHPREYYPLASN